MGKAMVVSKRIKRAFLAMAIGSILACQTPSRPHNINPKEPPEVRITQLNRQLKQDPKNPAILHQLGNAYFDAHNYKMARYAYEAELTYAPHSAAALCNLGLCLRRLGNDAAARKAYEQALALEPDDVTTLNNLLALQEIQQDTEGMIRTLKKLQRVLPQEIRPTADLAALLLREKRYREALPEFQRLIQLTPANATNYYNLGLCYYNLGDRENARAAWEKGLYYNQGQCDILKALAVLEWEEKDYEAAWKRVRQCQQYGGTVDRAFLEKLRKDSGINGMETSGH